MQDDNTRPLITSKELAEVLGCSRETVNNLRKRGRIKGYKFIHHWRYNCAEVLEALGKVDHEYSE